MKLIVRLFKNTGYLAMGSQVGNLLQFLFFIYFARKFGDSVVGQYSFAFSFTYILFLVFADLGLSAYLIREVARERSGDRQIFFKCLILRLEFLSIFTLLTIGIVLVFSENFSPDTITIILLLGLYHIFFSIADVFLAEFKGHDRMGLVAILNIFVRFVITGVGIIFILMDFDFLTVLICFPVGSFIYLISCIYLSFRYFGRLEWGLESFSQRGLFKKILPFAFTIIFLEVFYHIDIIMLRFLRDDHSVGIFSVANKIILALMGVMIFVHTALLPTFSRLFIESKHELQDIAKKTLRYLLIIGLPISVGLFVIAEKLIIFLYSDSFASSIEVLKILSWTIAFGFLAATYSVLLTAINRQTQKVMVVGICLAFNVVLNFILIPLLGYNGAAVVKLLSEALHLILMAYLVSKYFAFLHSQKALVKSAISTFIMYIFMQFFNEVGLIIIIPISSLVYLVSFGILRGYSREDVELIKRFVLKLFIKNRYLKINSSKN